MRIFFRSRHSTSLAKSSRGDTAVSEITTGLEQVLKTMNGVENATPGLTSAEFAQMLVVSAPAIMAFWSVIALSMNLWLAGRVVLISGRLEGGWPDLPTTLDLPRPLIFAFAAATIACAAPGVWRVGASTVAAALGVAFALQGLAALHRITRGRSARTGMLCAMYLLIILLFPLPLFVAAGVGIADNVRPLRRLSTPSTSQKP